MITARPIPTGRRPRVRRILLALLALILGLTACGRIPTDGQVYHYAEGETSSATPTPAYSPAGPREGDDPEQILRGFFEAGTGVEDDYAVARSFLTRDLAASWSPEDETWVYRDGITVEGDGGQDRLRAEIPVATHVDDRGIATSYDEPDTRTLHVGFTRVDGQWRISSIPNGTALTRTQFERLFRSFSLYFYDPTYTYAVPDIRWFVSRPTVATSLVRVLLQGPAPYLTGAVVSPIPAGTSLQRASVPVDGGVAQVGLTGGEISKAGQLTLERMHSQLRQTLSGITAISDTAISIDDKKIDVGQVSDYREPQKDPQVGEQQVGVREDELVSYAPDQVRAISDLQAPLSAPRQPGTDPSRSVYAYLDENRGHLGVRAKNGTALDLDLPGRLTRPSIDFRRWVWTASADGTVHAVLGDRDGQQPRTVTADWLRGQSVSSLRISRDGTRALVVTGEGSAARLWVAGVVREENGAPTRLLDPLRVSTTVHPAQARWISDSAAVIADTAGDGVEVMHLTGRSDQLDGLSGIEAISGGDGVQSVYAQTSSDVYRLSGASWSRVETAVRDLAYPG